MLTTIDFTKKRGQVTAVANGASPIPFLQKVTVSRGITGFYCKSTDTIEDGIKDFEIATLKLPAGFKYVDYNNGENPPNWENFQGSRDYDLFTNLVIFKEKGEKTPFHLCDEEVKDPNTGEVSISFGGSLHGCSELLLPYNDPNFILFYYDAGLIYKYANVPKKGEDVDLTKLPEGTKGYYLIPMLTSERNVVFHLIEHLKDDADDAFSQLNKLKTAFEDKAYRKCIALSDGLQLNDKLGIFVTIGIEEPKKN
jgi:hypothetical protein